MTDWEKDCLSWVAGQALDYGTIGSVEELGDSEGGGHDLMFESLRADDVEGGTVLFGGC